MTRDDLLLTPTGVLFQNRRLPCTLGRGGITCNKREGDGATPTGIYKITGLWFRPDRIPAQSLPRHARPITPRDLWCDAPDDPAYNQHVRAPFKASHEVLRRADPQYDLILTTDWNTPAAPHKGSAIFLHTWRRPGHPTAGCIAFSRVDLLWIIQRLTKRSRVIVRD
ncbi:L,D-transpeptidase family protein [Pararhodobacter oceanensis]|uniref:L,D-transpeptidase family protein n=1 Tax=Pararhodobacter oceanensis TaxID=2172121 RepID=UPI003A95DD24